MSIQTWRHQCKVNFSMHTINDNGSRCSPHSPTIGYYVTHPIGKISDLKKAIGHIGFCPAGSYLTTMSDKDRDSEVSDDVDVTDHELE